MHNNSVKFLEWCDKKRLWKDILFQTYQKQKDHNPSPISFTLYLDLNLSETEGSQSCSSLSLSLDLNLSETEGSKFSPSHFLFRSLSHLIQLCLEQMNWILNGRTDIFLLSHSRFFFLSFSLDSGQITTIDVALEFVISPVDRKLKESSAGDKYKRKIY